MPLTSVFLMAGMGINLFAQQPGFDMQFAVPASDTVQQETAAPAQNQPSSPTVTISDRVQVTQADPFSGHASMGSVHFDHAKPSEVFEWLKTMGLPFVVADGTIPGDVTVTMSINNQPVSDIADALAVALGGHFERRGAIRIFAKGPASGWEGQGFSFEPRTMPDIPGQFHTFVVPDGGMKGLGPVIEKDIKMGLDAAKTMNPKFMIKGDQHMELDPKIFQSDDFKGLAPLILKDDDLKNMDPAQRAKVKAEMAAAMAQANKEMAEAQVVIVKELAKNKEDMAKYKIVQDKAAQAMKKAIEIEMTKDHNMTIHTLTGAKGDHNAVNTIVIVDGHSAAKSDNIKKLIGSLSSDQKFQMRTRGYLFYADLTPTQKKLLGDKPKGRFELKYKIDGQELVIHGA